MSYADYRTGQPTRRGSKTDRSAYDTFASRMNEAPVSRRTTSEDVGTRKSNGSNPSSSKRIPTVTMSSSMPSTSSMKPFPSMMSSNAASSTRIENPYLTNAYASTRKTTNSSSFGGVDSGGGGMGFYASVSKGKGNVQAKLKDKAKISLAGFKSDHWKVTCAKATNLEIQAPKGKHVRVIMEGLRWGGSMSNRESPAGAIFYHLRKRMATGPWMVTLKSQAIFHHIFRDGNGKFVDYVAANARSIFKMEFYSDSTSEGVRHGGFIRSYAAYLEQWLTMKSAIKFPPGKSKEDDPAITRCYCDSPIEELLAALPVLMDTIDCLFQIEIDGPTRYVSVSSPTISMILRDMSILWIALSEGMIHMLDIFFELDRPEAQISFDVYQRFIATVESSATFFETAKSLSPKWKAPELGVISMELAESMLEYIEKGPAMPEEKEPQFSDDEHYDVEPEPEPEPEPESIPEDYYEPEPEYYSEEEPDFPSSPPPLPRSPTPSESSETEEEEEEEEESEESSSSEEDELDVLPPAPEKPPVPEYKPFDPLADFLGIQTGVGANHSNGQSNAVIPQSMAMQLYAGGGMIMHPAAVDQPFDERVSNIKGMMAASDGGKTQKSGFGVTGTNMQAALSGTSGVPPQTLQAQQQHHQMYNSMAMQQQQLLAYQTSMAAYQTMMHNQQQMAQYQLQQQSAANGMNPVGMMGAYRPIPQGNQTIPAMQGEKNMLNNESYRVQRGTKSERVNEDDIAFAPLLDQMKKTGISKQ